MTSKKGFCWEIFNRVPLVGIVRGAAFGDFMELLTICRKTGLTTLEITMNTPEVEKLIAYANEEVGHVMNIGAGTVCTEEELEKALLAGSQFIVTPSINEKVITACVNKGIPVFPGALTPTEIFKAWSLGAPVIKVFPATQMGSEYIRDIRGPFPQIPLLPTGGVKIENLKAYAGAGASGFGLGGSLFPKALIEAQKWTELESHIKSYIDEIVTLYQK